MNRGWLPVTALVALTFLGCGPRPDSGRAGTVVLPDGSLAFDERGRGPAMVFIHGGNLDRRMWDEQFAVFAEGRRVIRYDVRGFGQSSAPVGRYQSHRDLAALLDSLGVERATLVGLSLGGRIAIDFALTHPTRVDRLILAGSGLSGWPDWSGADTTWYPRIEAAVKDSNPAAIAAAWLSSDYMRPAMELPRMAPVLERLSRENTPNWLRPRDPEAVLDPPGAGRLRELRVPTLVLVGDRDSPPILRIADSLMAAVEGARLVRFPGAGHMVNMEEPARFNQAVRDFLAEAR